MAHVERAGFVLDTSALLAFRGDEPGAYRVEEILRMAERGSATVFVSFMTRMELSYRIEMDEGEAAARAALRLFDSLRMKWVSCEPDVLEVAARIKAQGGLSVADAWIAATAVVRSGTLVHKDPEFLRVRNLRQEFLKKT